MTIAVVVEKMPIAEPAGAGAPLGLTSEAADRLRKAHGENTIPDVSFSPLRALAKFWSPVPWMLEGPVVLEFGLGKFVEGSVIGVLLLFNAALGFFQEGRAQATLAALRSSLAITASVRRDGAWKSLPASELVPSDIVKLSLGSVSHTRVHDGEILVDQSMLTGESEPVEVAGGALAFAGAQIRRGEAVAEVTATGAETKFGRAAGLVQTASVVSSQQRTVFHVVRNIAAFNGLLILAMVAYAYFLELPIAQIVPLVLTAVLASIPVALPATFTLGAALGARDLGKRGVLPTRLSAVDEAGTMDVLCADKTGTLTQNKLTTGKVEVTGSAAEADVLAMAALASSEGTRPGRPTRRQCARAPRLV